MDSPQLSAASAGGTVVAPRREREVLVDRLRGFALLGVLMVNTPFMITSLGGITDASMPHVLDRLAGFTVWALFQAKSYVIFSFLFGYSLSLLLDKLAREGLPARRVYIQRLLALLSIGALHGMLLFPGDILAIYGVLGAMLIPLQRANDRTLIKIAITLWCVQVLLLASLLLFPAQEDLSFILAYDRALAQGSLVDATAARAETWPVVAILILFIQGPLVASLFCVGLLCGRRKLLADPERFRPQWVRLRRWGLLLGLPPQLIAAWLAVGPGAHPGSDAMVWALLLCYPTAPLLSAGYVAAIALLPERGLTRIVSADGRMSLSIYLGESLVMAVLAASWGGGWFGLATGPAFLLAFLVWLGLLLAAGIWSRRIGDGPAERLLRSLTYFRVTKRG